MGIEDLVFSLFSKQEMEEIERYTESFGDKEGVTVTRFEKITGMCSVKKLCQRFNLETFDINFTRKDGSVVRVFTYVPPKTQIRLKRYQLERQGGDKRCRVVNILAKEEKE